LHVTFSYGDGAIENKNPIAGLAMGFDKTLNANQNPTAMRHSSSRFRFKLRFTIEKLPKEKGKVK
jgi:hypothetical protein